MNLKQPLSELSFPQLGMLLVKQKKMMVAIVGVFLLGGYGYYLTLTPWYGVKGLVEIPLITDVDGVVGKDFSVGEIKTLIQTKHVPTSLKPPRPGEAHLKNIENPKDSARYLSFVVWGPSLAAAEIKLREIVEDARSITSSQSTVDQARMALEYYQRLKRDERKLLERNFQKLNETLLTNISEAMRYEALLNQLKQLSLVENRLSRALSPTSLHDFNIVLVESVASYPLSPSKRSLFGTFLALGLLCGVLVSIARFVFGKIDLSSSSTPRTFLENRI